ncbi:unnamed protein product, partial [Discosporangium mesarthrocarpum]
GDLFSWGLGEQGELGRKVCPMREGGEYDFEGIARDHLTPSGMYIADEETNPVSGVK